MGKRLKLTALLTVIYGYVVFGRLITTPLNEAPFPSLSSSMNCSSTLGSENISWYFVAVGESINVTIASGSIVYPAFTQLYRIDQPSRYASNLIIPSPKNSTAGTFTCADSEMVAHAQLLFTYGYSSSSNASDNLIYGDVIRLSCGMTYLGNRFITPIFYLYDTFSTFELIDNTTSPQLNISNSLITATATFYQTVSCPKIIRVQCNIYFGSPVGSLLPGSANNAPDPDGVAVGLLTKNVSCVLTADNVRIVGVISGAKLYFGGMLTCHVTSDPPANYSWSDLTYRNSSNGPHMMVWHGGSYQCTASIYVSGRWYSASRTVYNLTVAKLYSTAKPLYGPIAGGTKVTVIFNAWSKQISNISAVYLGGILQTKILISNRSSSTFVMTTLDAITSLTTNATKTLIGQPLPIAIEFTPGPYNISTNLSFTYKGNPEIRNISPTTFVVTGGTLVTATGTHLSSVANPLIQATIVVERGIEKNTTTDVSFESCEVTTEDGSRMTCRMPPINIPEDFLQVLDSQYHSRSTRDTNSNNQVTAENLFPLSRRKRYLSALSLNGTNGVDRVVIYVGFILDGYEKYKNINDALPETQLLFHSPPQINSTKDILEYDPNMEELISIKGKHMTRGCRMADYLVRVGSDVCENNDLQDNQLSCRPPKVKPLSTMNDTIYCDQHLSVTITLGYLHYQYACLAYTDQSSTRKVALIIGLTVGLAGFVLFLAILIVCILRCCRRRSRKQPDNQFNSGVQETSNPEYENALQLQSRNYDVYLRQQCRDSILPNEGYFTSADDFYRN